MPANTFNSRCSDVQLLVMAFEQGVGAPMVFAVVCNLPPGVHQYKFIGALHSLSLSLSLSLVERFPLSCHQRNAAPPTVWVLGLTATAFAVDGEWRHDESQPYMPDPLGNVNNWIFVGAPGAPPTVASAACATAQVQHPAQVSGPPPPTPAVPTRWRRSRCVRWMVGWR
jgi:hypothetical protein